MVMRRLEQRGADDGADRGSRRAARGRRLRARADSHPVATVILGGLIT